MSKPTLNVALIGSGFMGRAHSNGLRQARAFFDLPQDLVLKMLGARNAETGARLAARFGWEEVMPDWREIVERPDIDVVDIVTPVNSHAEIATAALRAGKAVICEKPLAANLAEALAMADAAEQAGRPTLCTYNIRATPAISYARQLVQQGAIGPVNQWRAAFQQGWLVNDNFPLTWRLRKETAGSGALGDLGSHSIDLARFIVGEVAAVSAIMHTFTRQRWIPVKDEGRNSVPTDQKGEVTVDDSVWSLLRFRERALGTMEATRMATGQLCANRFEVYGSEGGLSFDFMRMNELNIFSLKDERELQGWKTIHVNQPTHPYAAAWWPPGHALGYEHTFAHLMADFFCAFAQGQSSGPDFRDAARTQAVLEAIEQSSESRQWTDVAAV